MEKHTIPFAHSYTTSTRPTLYFSLNSSYPTLHQSCSLSTSSAILYIVSSPGISFGGMTGCESVFSTKTNIDNSATASSGVYAARTFSRIRVVKISSGAELIYCTGTSACRSNINYSKAHFTCNSTFKENGGVLVDEL
jgi:hypothetical protein